MAPPKGSNILQRPLLGKHEIIFYMKQNVIEPKYLVCRTPS